MQHLTIGYKDEPPPPWWSAWRRWARVTVSVLPAAVGIAILFVALVAAVEALAIWPNSNFISAIVGALIATLGGLLLQYVVFIVQAERDRRRDYRKEVALATVLMTELGEALARISVNLTILRAADPQHFDKLALARSTVGTPSNCRRASSGRRRRSSTSAERTHKSRLAMWRSVDGVPECQSQNSLSCTTRRVSPSCGRLSNSSGESCVRVGSEQVGSTKRRRS